MKKIDTTPLFTTEQLQSMNRESLMKLIQIQQTQTQSLQNQVNLCEDKLKELEFLNALLNDKLTLAQRRQFGTSSEKNTDGYDQLHLFNEVEEQADPTLEEPEYEEVHPSSYKRKKTKGKKENDLSRFPVDRIEHKLTKEERICEECNGILKVVTTEVHRYLRFVPARFETVEEVVYVYSCPKCSKMVRAKKDPSLLKGSIATASLVAGIINAKYVNGVPLYRQEQEFKRYELDIPTKNMANWVIRCSEDYLYPIYERMRQVLLKSSYIHCDETRCQVLGELDQKAETSNWMWVYMTDRFSESPQMVLFKYERTRAAYHLEEFLQSYEGTVTCDGYQPYHSLPEQIRISGCMAHARRRFDACLTALKKDFTKEQLKETVAYKALNRIGMLYKIEELIEDLSIEERYIERQKQSKPLMDAFFEWLHSMNCDGLDRKTLIGDAILYALNQEEYLRRYLEDGHLSIDNNACERSIKAFASHRRAWLFCKSIRGAEASAIVYSITETAKLHGLKPYNYLTYVMGTMLKHQNDTDYSFIDELLPWSKTLPEDCVTGVSKLKR